MATIYILKTDTLQLEKFEQVENIKYSKFSNFIVENSSSWSEADLFYLKDTHVSSDVFQTSTSFLSDPHWHDGAEHRLILQGSGMFYIPVDDVLVCVKCFAGDLIKLKPKCVHWFQNEGDIIAARFFSKNTTHTSYTTDISEDIIELRNQFINGFKLKI
jgi:cupin superfamily acireductone dioxygenase involved in methionine salvage